MNFELVPVAGAALLPNKESKPLTPIWVRISAASAVLNPAGVPTAAAVAVEAVGAAAAGRRRGLAIS